MIFKGMCNQLEHHVLLICSFRELEKQIVSSVIVVMKRQMPSFCFHVCVHVEYKKSLIGTICRVAWEYGAGIEPGMRFQNGGHRNSALTRFA